VREGRLKLAGAKFSRAARALHQTIQKLETTPRPSADESRLARWFTHLNGETKLLEKVAARLRKVSLGRTNTRKRSNQSAALTQQRTSGFLPESGRR
jgi:hypothetical protein